MPYTKVRNVYASFPQIRQTVNGNPSTFNMETRKFQVQRSITGNHNPKWKEQIAKHVNATTVMSGTFESVTARPSMNSEQVGNPNVPGGVETRVVKGFETAYQYLPASDFHPNPSIDPSSAIAQAHSKALSQVRKAQTAMSGGVFLGEIGEALRMLRHPAASLHKAIQERYLRPLKAAKKRNPQSWKKTISQTWLEGCFGWLPFVNDLEDAMKAYKEVSERLTDRYSKIKGIGKTMQLINESLDYYAPLANLIYKGHMTDVQEARCIIRGEVKAQAVTTAVDKARVFGLSPNEFIPTVWELVPWSFLVDYFTNVGDIIENACTDTSQVAWLEMSVVQERRLTAVSGGDYRLNYNNKKGDPKWIPNYSSGYVQYKRKVVARSIPLTLKVPPLRFEVPTSPFKQLNMLALWTQANDISSQDHRKLRGRTFR